MRIRSTKAGLIGLLTSVMVGVIGSGTAAAEPLADKSLEVITDDGSLSNEESIRVLVQSGYQALRNADHEGFNRLQCKKYQSSETGEPNDDVAEVLRGVVLDDVNSIVVNGDTATAVARHHMADAPEKSYTNTVTLKLENGIWTLC